MGGRKKGRKGTLTKGTNLNLEDLPTVQCDQKVIVSRDNADGGSPPTPNQSSRLSDRGSHGHSWVQPNSPRIPSHLLRLLSPLPEEGLQKKALRRCGLCLLRKWNCHRRESIFLDSPSRAAFNIAFIHRHTPFSAAFRKKEKHTPFLVT